MARTMGEMALSTRASRLKALKIVPAFFLQTALVLGTIKSIGVFLPELELNLGITSTDIGISLGLFQAFTFGFSPISAYIYCNASNTYRRLLIISGAVLASVGLIAGSTIANNAQLAFYLSISGMGLNILSTVLVITLHSQAGDQFKLIYGLGKSGYSLGMALVPFLAHYLMTVYGWRGSLMIVGGIMAHLIPFSMFVDTTTEGDASSVDEGSSEDNLEGSSEGSSEDSPEGSSERSSERSPERSPEESSEETSENSPEEFQEGSQQRRSEGSPERRLEYSREESTILNSCEKSSHKNGECNSCQVYGSGGVTGKRKSIKSITVDQGNNLRFDENETTGLLILPSQSERINSDFEKNLNDRKLDRNILTTPRDKQSVSESISIFGKVTHAITESIFNRDRWLTFLVITTGLFGIIDGGWHAFLIPRAVSRGMSTSTALTLAYSAGGGCFIGRLFSSVVLNTKIFSGHDWFNILTAINCISLLVDILLADFGLVIVTSFVSALCISACNILLVLIYKERSPITDFPKIYAVSEVIFGTAQFTGAFVSGFLADAFHNFNASFIFLVAVEACILVMMVILKLTKSTPE